LTGATPAVPAGAEAELSDSAGSRAEGAVHTGSTRAVLGCAEAAVPASA